ncbi:MAG: exodeoxyribonuclease I [Spirochaetaceae bacterium]|nr:exodeoxyribonuclease I [Spirochaetaceae bacterium]
MNIQRNKDTFLWYDLETFGLNSRFDRIAQFAAIRTDNNFEIIGDEIIYYCKVSSDYLPSIEACLVTGITPQECNEKGMNEEEFITKINSEFSQANTTVVGFNSIKFDDEFIRNALYRNLSNPYSREYKNGCSRWDILPLIRATHDLRGSNIDWPEKNESNYFTFKLTELTKANHIDQVGAHDALVDVRATIAMAKLIHERQPSLYSYYYNLRSKYKIQDELANNRDKMICVSDTKLTSENGCTTLALKITDIPNSSNVYLFDLTKDITPLLKASEDDIINTEGLFYIAINKCPFIATAKVINKEVATSLGIDIELCQERATTLLKHKEITDRIIKGASSIQYSNDVDDVDSKIYTAFFSGNDTYSFKTIKKAKLEEKLLLLEKIKFEDSRAKELVYRYIYRNNEEALNPQDKEAWYDFAFDRITNPPVDPEQNSLLNYYIRLDEFIEKENNLASNSFNKSREYNTLLKLKEYGIQLENKLKNKVN